MIFVSLVCSQTPVYTARSCLWGWSRTDSNTTLCRSACLCPSFHLYTPCQPTEGWPGWVDLSGWLHTKMVYPSADVHPSKH